MTTFGLFLPALLTHDTAAAKAWSACTSCHDRASVRRCHQYTTTGLATL